MRFALNYSPQAEDLLKRGLIEIDLFKLPAWDDLIAQVSADYPVYVHFAFQAGTGKTNASDQFDAANRHRTLTGTRYINTHLAARFEDVTDPDDPEAVLAPMLRDLRVLVERFGADNVISENIPFPETIHDKPYFASDPDVICRAVNETGVGFLLDVGHARRVAEYLAIDPRRYIERLPVDKLREVHITGLGYNLDGRRVDHMPMMQADWELFTWVMANIHSGRWPQPDIVACEYGGIGPKFDWRSDPDVIAHDVPRLLALVRG